MSAGRARIEQHPIRTPDGWRLNLIRGVAPDGKPANGPPVLFVPGYGMNAWAFRYHPTGPSYLEVLLEAGLDPWSIDNRGTSTSRAEPDASRRVRLRDLAFVDLPVAIDRILRVTGAVRLHAIGCSLGGSLLYALATRPGHRLDRLVGVGAPLVWTSTRRTRLLARAMPLGGSLPLRGTRRFARLALPLAVLAAPSALGIYLNPKITDTRDVRGLTETVEDPIPSVNRAIGAWMRAGDLRLDGVIIREALASFRGPLLALYGSGDGIVPEAAALSVVGATGGPVVTERIEHPSGELVGHADLFIGDIAPEAVFARTARFLTG